MNAANRLLTFFLGAAEQSPDYDGDLSGSSYGDDEDDGNCSLRRGNLYCTLWAKPQREMPMGNERKKVTTLVHELRFAALALSSIKAQLGTEPRCPGMAASQAARKIVLAALKRIDRTFRRQAFIVGETQRPKRIDGRKRQLDKTRHDRPLATLRNAASAVPASVQFPELQVTPGSTGQSVRVPEWRELVRSDGRAAAGRTSRHELEGYLSERANLIKIEFQGGRLGSADKRRLRYLEWQIGRVEDAQLGPALDAWEALIAEQPYRGKNK